MEVNYPEKPVHDGVRMGIDAFLDWETENNPEYLASEEVIYYANPRKPTHDFCGTLDVRFRMGKDLCLGDFKTSKRINFDMFIQLALYAIAVEQINKKEKVKWLYVFRLPKEVTDKPHGRFQVKKVKFTPTLRRIAKDVNRLKHDQVETKRAIGKQRSK